MISGTVRSFDVDYLPCDRRNGNYGVNVICAVERRKDVFAKPVRRRRGVNINVIDINFGIFCGEEFQAKPDDRTAESRFIDNEFRPGVHGDVSAARSRPDRAASYRLPVCIKSAIIHLRYRRGKFKPDDNGGIVFRAEQSARERNIERRVAEYFGF